MDNDFRREQHYAVSSSGVLSDIRTAHDSTDDYYCVHCGCRMLKRCGKIRTWHFAHDWRYANDDQKKCSYESYLHSYAKLRLKQWFESSKELIIRYDVQNVCHLKSSCSFSHYKDACTRIDSKTFDLKKCLDRCSVEESVQSGDCRFRADLLWYSSTKPTNAILIEVKVSHGCTEKKKSANVRTIEFEISSEEDIESIVSCNEISESETVHFYGFNTNNSVYDISPEIELRKFILYKSGKTFSDKQCNCQNYTDRYPSSILEITTYSYDDNTWPLTRYGLAKASELRCKFSNCHVCKHNIYSEDADVFVCEMSGDRIGKGSDALKCEYYELNDNAIEKALSYPSLDIVDVWHREIQLDN